MSQQDQSKATVYIASKTVLATPMTAKQYEDYLVEGTFLEGTTPTTEEADAEGFMIEVPEGTTNRHGHSGRLEWMPKDEFLYRHQAVGPVSDLPAFLRRLQVELAQLDIRVKDAIAFTGTDLFMGLTTTQRDLLLEQCRVMSRYSYILNSRIEGHLAQIAHKKQALADHK